MAFADDRASRVLEAFGLIPVLAVAALASWLVHESTGGVSPEDVPERGVLSCRLDATLGAKPKPWSESEPSQLPLMIIALGEVRRDEIETLLAAEAVLRTALRDTPRDASVATAATQDDAEGFLYLILTTTDPMATPFSAVIVP